jgi:hypothetical protein
MIFERFSREFRDFHTDKKELKEVLPQSPLILTVFYCENTNKSFQKFKEVSKRRGLLIQLSHRLS